MRELYNKKLSNILVVIYGNCFPDFLTHDRALNYNALCHAAVL